MQPNNTLIAKYNELLTSASSSEVLMRINEQLKPVLMHIDNESVLEALSPIKINNLKIKQLIKDTIRLIDDAHWQSSKRAWKMTDIVPMGLRDKEVSYLYPQICTTSLYRLVLPFGQEIITWIDKDHPFSLLNEDNNLFFKEDNKMGLFEPKFTLMQQAHIRSKYIDKLNDLMLSIDYLKAEEDQYVLIELTVNEKDSTTGNIPKQLLILYRDGTIFALSKRLDNTFSLSDRSVITEFLNREEGYLTDYFASSAYYTNYPDIKRNSNIKRSH